MILDHPMTEGERRSAQRIYCQYCGMNAVATAGSSSTIQALLALQLGFGTSAASCIGPMDFLRYAFLPLGFLLARHWGVCGGKRVTLTAVSVLCVFIALSGWVPAALSGVFFFPGILLTSCCMATLWASEFPLQKNITTPETLPRLLSMTQCVASATGLAASLAIAWILHSCQRGIVLPLFFCAAAVLYFLTGQRISRMPEPAILKQLAAKPLLGELKRAWHSAVVCRQMAAGYVQNVILATMLPMNILAAKTACGGDDSMVIILTSLQTLMVIASAWIFKLVTERLGPRRMMLGTWPAVWMLAAYWCLAPVQQSFLWTLPPFLLAGFINVGFGTSTSSYFSLSVPNDLQVGGTIMVYIFHGGLAGVTGVLVNPLVVRIAEWLSGADAAPMAPFRTYYLVTGIVSLLGIVVTWRLPECFRKPAAAH